jgi:hypothetical protein
MTSATIPPTAEPKEQIIVKLDSQIANSIELCGARYEMEHVLNMRPIDKAPALEHGDVMHRMLAHYYRQHQKGRINPQEAAIVTQECLLIGREATAQMKYPVTEFEEMDAPTFQSYILRNQYDGWKVLDVEQPFSKVLYEDAYLMIIYEGIVDLRIAEPKGDEATVDHKTESRKSHPYILSNQMEGYQWAFGSKVIINKVGYQVSLPDAERFRRYHHMVSDALLQEWIDDMVRSVQKAITWHSTGIFPRNRTSCDKYSGCMYQKICACDPEVREFKLQANFIKQDAWDPFTRDAE